MAKKLYYDSPEIRISELEPEDDIVTASTDEGNDVWGEDQFWW